jgi:hypothetical protein
LHRQIIVIVPFSPAADIRRLLSEPWQRSGSQVVQNVLELFDVGTGRRSTPDGQFDCCTDSPSAPARSTRSSGIP